MTDDSYMKRPEITRTNEYLAKDQRKMLDFQRRKLKYSEENIRKDFNAFLGSKFYENIQRVFNQCWTICGEPEIQSDSISLTTSYDKFFKNKKKFPDTSCLNNCVSKKEESYQMLVQVNISINI